MKARASSVEWKSIQTTTGATSPQKKVVINKLQSFTRFLLFEAELNDYGEFLGLSLPEEAHLLHFAKEGLVATVPEPWVPCINQKQDVFYKNKETGQCQWSHPLDEEIKRKIQAVKTQKSQRGKKEETQGLKRLKSQESDQASGGFTSRTTPGEALNDRRKTLMTKITSAIQKEIEKVREDCKEVERALSKERKTIKDSFKKEIREKHSEVETRKSRKAENDEKYQKMKEKREKMLERQKDKMEWSLEKMQLSLQISFLSDEILQRRKLEIKREFDEKFEGLRQKAKVNEREKNSIDSPGLQSKKKTRSKFEKELIQIEKEIASKDFEIGTIVSAIVEKSNQTRKLKEIKEKREAIAKEIEIAQKKTHQKVLEANNTWKEAEIILDSLKGLNDFAADHENSEKVLQEILEEENGGLKDGKDFKGKTETSLVSQLKKSLAKKEQTRGKPQSVLRNDQNRSSSFAKAKPKRGEVQLEAKLQNLTNEANQNEQQSISEAESSMIGRSEYFFGVENPIKKPKQENGTSLSYQNSQKALPISGKKDFSVFSENWNGQEQKENTCGNSKTTQPMRNIRGQKHSEPFERSSLLMDIEMPRHLCLRKKNEMRSAEELEQCLLTLNQVLEFVEHEMEKIQKEKMVLEKIKEEVGDSGPKSENPIDEKSDEPRQVPSKKPK